MCFIGEKSHRATEILKWSNNMFNYKLWIFEGSVIMVIAVATVVFYGNAVFVSDENEKKEALKILCEKYLPEYMDHFDSAMKRSFAVTQIIRIDFESFSAKEKRGKVGE